MKEKSRVLIGFLFSLILVGLPFCFAWSESKKKLEEDRAVKAIKTADDEKISEVTLEIMLESLEGKDPATKQKIIRRIAILGDKNGIGPMVFIMLNSEEDFDTRREGAKAAIVLGGEAAYAPILKVLDGRRFGCKDTINALAEISDRRFVEPLIRYSTLDSIEEACRSLALKSYIKMMGAEETGFNLQVIKGTEGENALVDIARRSNNYYERHAIYILGAIKSKKSVPVLIKKLTSKNYSIKTQALKALGEIGDKESVVPISQILKSEPSLTVKEECLKALIKIGGEWKKYIKAYYSKSTLRHKAFILRVLDSVRKRRVKRFMRRLLREENAEDRKRIKEFVKEDTWA